MKRRILSLALVVVLVMSLLPMSAFAAGDDGDSCPVCGGAYSQCGDIVAGGQAKHVVIEDGGEVRLAFTPEEDGCYVFRSENCSDSRATLRSDESGLAGNDDGSENYNFKIFYYCTAGATYYLDCASCQEYDEYDVYVEKFTYSFSWDIDEDGVLTISGNGEMNEYGSDGAPWGESRWSVSSIVIESGITKISSYAFWDCYNAQSVTIPASVTSVGSGAFGSCAWIKEINYSGTIAQWNAIDIEAYGNDKLFSSAIHCTDGDIDNTGKCGTNATWSYEDGVLTISGSGDMWGFEWGGAPWYNDRESITSVVVEEGITSIGANAFNGCININNVSLPSSLTTIGESAFCFCYGLTELEIPDGVKTIVFNAFSECNNLVSISLPENLETIEENAFWDCWSLEEIDYGGTAAQWNSISKNENQIPYMAVIHCTDGNIDNTRCCGDCIDNATWSLSEDGILTISGTGCVVDRNRPWSKVKSSIRSVVISEGITYLGSCLFYDCDNLTTVSFADTVETIGAWAFEDCSSLSSVTIPTSVEQICCGAFAQCRSLHDIYYGGTMAQWNAIEKDENSKLESIKIHCTDGDIDNSGKCGTNATWSLEDGVLTIGGSGDMWDYFGGEAPWYNDRESITSVVIENGVTKIGGCAFCDCYNLETVSLPNSITTINDDAFNCCVSLSSLTIPAGVTYIGWGALYGCNSLTEISYGGTMAQWNAIEKDENSKLESIKIHCTDGDIDNSGKCGTNATWSYEDGVLTISGSGDMWDYAGGEAPWYNDRESITSVVIENGVTYVGGQAFWDCNSIESVELPDSIGRIGFGAFEYCNSLNSIEIPNSVTRIEVQAFCSCDNLTNVTIPSSITYFEPAVFEGCNSLTEISYGGTMAQWNAIEKDENSKLERIKINCTDGDIDNSTKCGTNATWSLENGVLTISGSGDMWGFEWDGAPWYNDRESITSVVIENGVTKIGGFAFENCYNLETVSLPNSITTINDNAFYYCDSLSSLTIPAGVTYIGWEALYGCNSLTEISYGGTMAQWNAIEKSEDNAYLNRIIIHCTDGDIDNYHKCGDSATWSYNNGVLTISGTGAMADYEYGEQPWMDFQWDIDSIVIEDGITGIGSNCFADLDLVKSISIPTTITELDKDDFRYCRHINRINYSGTTAQWMAINHPGWDDVICHADICCTDGNLDLSSYCGGDGNWGTNATWSYENGVLTISGTGAVDDDISAFDVPWAEYIDDITSVVVEDGITYIGCIFYLSRNLTSITVPENITMGQLYPYGGDIPSLRDIYYGGTAQQWESCLERSQDYEYFTTLFNIHFIDGTVRDNFHTCGDGITWSIENGTLIISGEGEITHHNWTIDNSEQITAVVIPEGITAICDYAFANCTGISSIYLPDSVTEIGYGAFYGCTSLESISIPAGVTIIGASTFYNCQGLQRITLGSGVQRIGADVNCLSSDSNMSCYDSAFYGCINLSEVEYEGTTSQWNAINVATNPYGDLELLRAKASCADGEIPSEANRCGYSATWSFENGVLTISGTGKVDDYKYSTAPWAKYKDVITSVVVEDGITEIGAYAFSVLGHEIDYKYPNLKTVNLPESITAFGEAVFGIPGVAYYNEALEQYCYKSVIGGTINYAGTIEQWGQISNAPHTFLINCSDGVIDDFFCCGTGEDLWSVSDNARWSIEGDVLTISGTGETIGRPYEPASYWDSKDVRTVVIGEGIESVGYCLFCDMGISAVELPDSLTTIERGAFQFTKLQSVTLPENISFIGEDAFYECNELTDIYYEGTVQQWNNVVVLDNKLANSAIHCTDGDVPPADISWTFEDGVLAISGTGAMIYSLWDIDADEITSVVINEGITGIGNYMFCCYPNLTSVELPDSLKFIAGDAFDECNNLTNINIPENVAYIGSGAFFECSNIEQLNGMGSISVIKEFSFMSCNNLTSVEIPDTVTKIEYCSFKNCYSLTNIEIPDSVTCIRYNAFENCTGLESVVIPDSVTSVEWGAFENCSGLESVVISEGVENVGSWAFADCTNLKSVTIPGSVTDIQYCTFENCTSLTDVTIPSGVIRIKSCAFGDCSSLERVVLPASIEELSGSAFRYCDALTDIYYCGTEEQWNEIDFDGFDDIYPEGVTVHFNYEPVQPADEVKLVVSNERAKAGEEVTVSVSIEDNPGVMAIMLGISYDENKLQLLSVEDGIFTDWDYSGTAVWIGSGDTTENGVILKLKFKVLEDVEDGEIAVSVTAQDGDIANYAEESLTPVLVSGKITVYSVEPGDMTGDGKVNAIDLVRLKKYISGADVELVASGDVTGDGRINAVDLVRLQKFLSGADVELH